MDHYKVLGLSRNATNEEIKEAFRKLAMKFHPDKHSYSSKSVRDGAIIRFKQVSEAYETLIDDRKRADYNIRCYDNSSSSYGGRASGFNSSGYGYGYDYDRRSGSDSSYGYYRRTGNGEGMVSKFEIALRYLTTRSFLLNLVFAGTFVSALLGGTVVISSGRDALWKMHNPGKSFEDAMESIEKAKAVKDKT